MKNHLTIAFLGWLLSSLALAQGPLLPPSLTPAPTMKSLDQIEARTPIPASPATPVAGPHFTITQPGSYYLTGNITVSTGDGIRITAASDVSIDLNGFTIRSALTGSENGSAIACFDNFARLTVRHGSLVSGSNPPGTLQGFSNGIIAGGVLSASLISGVHVHGMSNSGMDLESGNIVENCTASKNGGHGILNSAGITTHCIATFNGGYGIFAFGGVVSNCNAFGNGSVDIRWSGKIHNTDSGTAQPTIP